VQFVGHLAAGALAAAGGAKLRGARPAVLWVLVPGALGGVTPDLLDKAILALEASRYGRTVGHSLVFLAVMAAAWAVARRWGSRGAARAAGIASPVEAAGSERAASPVGAAWPERVASPGGTVQPLGAAGPLGFWVLGVATHLVMDLADDALRGLLGGGQTFYTFFAWPFATPYAWVMRNPNALGGWPWSVTPLEVAVLAGAGVWLGVAGWRAWGGRVGGDGTPALPSAVSREPPPGRSERSLGGSLGSAERPGRP
jgi:hypothetical protein